MDLTSPPKTRIRQKYSKEFKSEVVAQARQPHVSIASVVSVLRTHVVFCWICVKAKWVASDEAIILRSGCSFGSATWLEHL